MHQFLLLIEVFWSAAVMVSGEFSAGQDDCVWQGERVAPLFEPPGPLLVVFGTSLFDNP